MSAALTKLPGASYLRNRLHKWPFVRSLAVAYLYPVERQLLHGTHTPKSDHTSIIHFSLNKAATQYVRNILVACAAENAVAPVQFNQFAWMTDIEFLDKMGPELFDEYKHVFRPKGYCYTVFANYVKNIPQVESYLKVLMVRDPRDILTSHYFSQAYSHPLPGDPEKAAAFQRARELVLQKTVDEFVLGFSENVGDSMDAYLSHLVDQPNLLVTRYEDMVADFPRWLDELLAFSALKISEQTRANLIGSAVGPVPTGQRPDQKRRQVVPGDHRRKLKAETIAALNERFAAAIERFGYAR
ncbi:MAG TPA: sulfotransferase domain-containing protein, partial [Rhodospirillales bacterium]|nr:sulfotransferase domain-containing protein [Rhodospirillales bacterium]